MILKISDFKLFERIFSYWNTSKEEFNSSRSEAIGRNETISKMSNHENIGAPCLVYTLNTKYFRLIIHHGMKVCPTLKDKDI